MAAGQTPIVFGGNVFYPARSVFTPVKAAPFQPPVANKPSSPTITSAPIAKIIPQGTVRRTAGATSPIISQPHTQNNSVYAALNQRIQKYVIL